MATRPIFMPTSDGPLLVEEVAVSFTWHSGMAPSQKRRNVVELHAAAERRGLSPILEISSNSELEVGRRLSAFNLVIQTEGREIPFESAYQGSKVFERGGPFVDLYNVDARTAKKDERLKEAGKIIAFEFLGTRFPNHPPTAFYDWMYVCTLYPHSDWLRRLNVFRGFSDIAFNPERSLNCQARACAIFMALNHRHLLGAAAESFENFLEIASYSERHWLTGPGNSDVRTSGKR